MKTLRELLDDVESLDKEAAQANQAARVATENLDAAKTLLMEAMNQQGTDIVRKEGFTASVSSKQRPHVVDWDAFYAFVKRSGSLHLFERRVSAKAYSELLEQRRAKPIPGTQTFDYQTLNLRRG